MDRRRGIAVAVGMAVALLLGVGGPVLWLRQAIADAKDHRDFGDLTAPWPRPLDQLPVPDELPARGVTGELHADGLSLWYPLTAEPGSALIAYQVQVVDERGEPPWSVSCGARAVVVCTDLGGGYTLVKELDTDNSDPGTAVRRRVGDRLVMAAVIGDHPEVVERLRRAVTETHVPTRAELLRILRPAGYQTDWS